MSIKYTATASTPRHEFRYGARDPRLDRIGGSVTEIGSGEIVFTFVPAEELTPQEGLLQLLLGWAEYIDQSRPEAENPSLYAELVVNRKVEAL
jgi:hypothetical protein